MREAPLIPHADDDLFRHAPTSDDPGWFDRFYLNLHCPTEPLTISHGTGTYPQVGVIDGFSILAGHGAQRSFRVSAEKRWDERRVEAGPLAAEIALPLRRWHLHLGENDAGFSYDLEFEGDLGPIDAGRMTQRSRKTGELVDFSHFVQLGRIRGTLVVDGKARELDVRAWYALRDRSWGVRPRVGYAPLEDQPPPEHGRHDWLLGRVGDRAVFYLLAGGGASRPPYLLGAGVAGPDGEIKVTNVERKTKWDASGRFRGASATLRLENGEAIDLEVGAPTATLYLRGGLYGGWRGANQGEKRGALVCDSDRWDTENRDVLFDVAGLNDHVCKLRTKSGEGFGIYEVASGT